MDLTVRRWLSSWMYPFGSVTTKFAGGGKLLSCKLAERFFKCAALCSILIAFN